MSDVPSDVRAPPLCATRRTSAQRSRFVDRILRSGSLSELFTRLAALGQPTDARSDFTVMPCTATLFDRPTWRLTVTLASDPATNTLDEMLQRTYAEAVPVIGANRVLTEELRHPADQNIQALEDAGFYKLTVPKKFGGFEASMSTQIEVLRRIAIADPNTAWAVCLHTAANWIAGSFPDELQAEVYSAAAPRNTFVSAPTGRVTPQPGGTAIVNGKWAFTTGNTHAQWATFAALMDQDGLDPAPVFVTMPYSDLERVDDWYAFGMGGTGSNSVAAKDVRVPEHRIIALPDLVGPKVLSVDLADNGYFHTPIASTFLTVGMAVPLGIAEGALQLWRDRLPGRQITYSRYPVQAEAPITHHQVAEAAMKIETVRQHTRLAAELLERFTVRPPTMDERGLIRGHVGYTTRLAKEAVEILFQASGASSIQRSVPIQQYHRDMQALATHAFLSPTTNLEVYGRTFLGLDPDTAWI